MDTIVLDNIGFEPDAGQMAGSLRLDKSGEGFEVLVRLIKEARELARPRAMYGVVYIEERGENFVVAGGVRFQSRVLAVNLEQAHRVFPFVATCGLELDRWAESFEDGLERFLAGAVRGHGLVAAIQALDTHIRENHHPGKTAMMNPGSIQDWPLSEQAPLFELLGDTFSAVGVTLKSDLFMSPALTASGIKFPTESSFESCQLCPREDCPGRRAPYDPGLYKRRYESR